MCNATECSSTSFLAVKQRKTTLNTVVCCFLLWPKETWPCHNKLGHGMKNKCCSMMWHATEECSSRSFLAKAWRNDGAECLATLWHIVCCCNSKNNATQCHGTSFSCCSMKNDIAAYNTMPWHIAQCHGTKNMVTVQRALPQHKAQLHGTKNITAAWNVMPWHKEYGHGTNTKHQCHQVDCYFIWVFGFFPKTFLVCCGRFLDVVVLLVTAITFPHVHATAESILQNLCWLASILCNDYFFKSPVVIVKIS